MVSGDRSTVFCLSVQDHVERALEYEAPSTKHIGLFVFYTSHGRPCSRCPSPSVRSWEAPWPHARTRHLNEQSVRWLLRVIARLGIFSGVLRVRRRPGEDGPKIWCKHAQPRHPADWLAFNFKVFGEETIQNGSEECCQRLRSRYFWTHAVPPLILTLFLDPPKID